MKLWSFLQKWSSRSPTKQEEKTIDEAIFELALICAVPQEPYLNLFLVSGLKTHSPGHFGFSREATAYMGGRLWTRIKGKIPRGEQEERVGDLAGKVAKVHCHQLLGKGVSDSEIDAQVDPDMDYSLAKIAEFVSLGDCKEAQLRHLEAGLRSIPELSNNPEVVSTFAKALEVIFDRWALSNPIVFQPTAISESGNLDVHTEYGMSFREAVDIVGDYGEVFAILNESNVEFKPESRLPASRQIIKDAMKLSLLGDPKMPENLRNSHDFMYPQLALFVPDCDAQRAAEFSRQQYLEFIGGREIKGLDPIKMSVIYFGGPQVMSENTFYEGLEFFGKEFYNSQYFEARDSADARFMRTLAVRCWTDMWKLVCEWREFVNAQNL